VLLLDDGLIRLTVEAVDGSRIVTRVDVGGTLPNNKGINRMGGGLSAPALTPKDMEDMTTAAAIDADYLVVPQEQERHVRDLRRLRIRGSPKQSGNSPILPLKTPHRPSDEVRFRSLRCIFVMHRGRR